MNNFSSVTHTIRCLDLRDSTVPLFARTRCLENWPLPNATASKLSVVITFHNEPEIWRKRKENPELKGHKQEGASSPVLSSLSLSHLGWPRPWAEIQTFQRSSEEPRCTHTWRGASEEQVGWGPACKSPGSPTQPSTYTGSELCQHCSSSFHQASFAPIPSNTT